MRTICLPVKNDRVLRVVSQSLQDCVQLLIPHLEPRRRGFVVHTLNLHHWWGCRQNEEVHRFYASADIIVPDGWPIARACRKLSHEPAEPLPGVELAEHLIRYAQPRHRLFLLGSQKEIVQRACERLHRFYRFPGTIEFFHGYFHNDEEPLEKISEFAPHILLVGMGFPKQEIWLARYRDRIDFGIGLCVGGTIDYLAGNQKRSPRIFQKARLEWLYRWTRSPRRYLKRYWWDGPRAFVALEREIRHAQYMPDKTQ